VKLASLPGDELAEIASNRRVEPRKLKSLLGGDLDWIVMKALEKDRSLRYQTASGLGADVQRFLNHEPVVARPPNRWYRFRKLVRRNKAVFAMVGAVSLALIFGLGTSSWLFVQERDARRQQVLLREEAEHARASESHRRIAAEASAKISEAAVLITCKKIDYADRLVEGIEISSIQPSLEAASVFRDLGCWNVTRGQWEKAANLFLEKQRLAEAVDGSDLTDNATRDLPAIATAFIVANRLPDYRQLIREAAIHFARTDNPIAAEHVLKISTYLPNEAGMLSLLEPLERTAEKSLVDEPNNDENQCMLAWRALAVSTYYYRRDNLPSAIHWARRCLQYTDTAATRTAMAQAVLAMAEHRLNPTEGRGELESARTIVETKFPDHTINISGIGNDASGFWNDWITALLLYREADREFH
jgi:eukaryotic-like serine/threonine-protein kinase